MKLSAPQSDLLSDIDGLGWVWIRFGEFWGVMYPTRSGRKYHALKNTVNALSRKGLLLVNGDGDEYKIKSKEAA